jgi:hypothetical protein
MVGNGLGWNHQHECKLVSFCPLCPEGKREPLLGKFVLVFFAANSVKEKRGEKEKNNAVANRHVVECPKHGLQIPRIKVI